MNRWSWANGFLVGIFTAILIDTLIQTHILRKETQQLTEATAKLDRTTESLLHIFKD
jgi:hypothetical protein